MHQLKEPMANKDLENHFKPSQKEDVKKTIRFLLDEELIFVTEDGKLSLAKDKPRSGFNL